MYITHQQTLACAGLPLDADAIAAGVLLEAADVGYLDYNTIDRNLGGDVAMLVRDVSASGRKQRDSKWGKEWLVHSRQELQMGGSFSTELQKLLKKASTAASLRFHKNARSAGQVREGKGLVRHMHLALLGNSRMGGGSGAI